MSQWGQSSLNEQMVRAGLAYHWTEFGDQTGLREAEAKARSEKLGIWRRAGGGVRPWVYRQKKRLRTVPARHRRPSYRGPARQRPMRRLQLYRKRSRGHAMTTRTGKRRSRYLSTVRMSNKTQGCLFTILFLAAIVIIFVLIPALIKLAGFLIEMIADWTRGQL